MRRRSLRGWGEVSAHRPYRPTWNRRFSPILFKGFDEDFADFIENIRCTGKLDTVGIDAPPGRSGDSYKAFVHRHRGALDLRSVSRLKPGEYNRQARQQAEWEAEQRERQLAREAEADKLWDAQLERERLAIRDAEQRIDDWFKARDQRRRDEERRIQDEVAEAREARAEWEARAARQARAARETRAAAGAREAQIARAKWEAEQKAKAEAWRKASEAAAENARRQQEYDEQSRARLEAVQLRNARLAEEAKASEAQREAQRIRDAAERARIQAEYAKLERQRYEEWLVKRAARHNS